MQCLKIGYSLSGITSVYFFGVLHSCCQISFLPKPHPSWSMHFLQFLLLRPKPRSLLQAIDAPLPKRTGCQRRRRLDLSAQCNSRNLETARSSNDCSLGLRATTRIRGNRKYLVCEFAQSEKYHPALLARTNAFRQDHKGERRRRFDLRG